MRHFTFPDLRAIRHVVLPNLLIVYLAVISCQADITLFHFTAIFLYSHLYNFDNYALL